MFYKTLLSTAFVAACAASLQAAIVIDISKTNTGASFDEYTLKVTQMTGTTAGRQITGIQMSIEAPASAVLGLTGTTAQRAVRTTNAVGSGIANQTYLNFDSQQSLTFVGSTNAYTSVAGTWFTTDTTLRLFPGDIEGESGSDGFDNSLLGKIYVSTGFVPNLSGTANTAVVGVGGNVSDSLTFVPEPTVLGFAGLVAMGLGRRRR
jgi:hypothetical protein